MATKESHILVCNIPAFVFLIAGCYLLIHQHYLAGGFCLVMASAGARSR